MAWSMKTTVRTWTPPAAPGVETKWEEGHTVLVSGCAPHIRLPEASLGLWSSLVWVPFQHQAQNLAGWVGMQA